jgi:hypothetical protein
MAKPIIPRIIRGRLFYQTADVLFPTFTQAACASSAAECHRLDIAEPLDELIFQRTEALADTRRAGDDFATFSAASKRETRCQPKSGTCAGKAVPHERYS